MATPPLEPGYYWAKYSPTDVATVIHVYQPEGRLDLLASCLGWETTSPASDWVLLERLNEPLEAITV